MWPRVGAFKSILPRDAMLARYLLSSFVRPFVCHKSEFYLASRKQQVTAARDSSLLTPKTSAKFQRVATRISGLSRGVVCVIPRLAVLIQYRHVTDRRTDRQTRWRLIPALASVARVKMSQEVHVFMFFYFDACRRNVVSTQLVSRSMRITGNLLENLSRCF